MPPELSEQLVYDLEAWYRSHSVRQKDLASSLNMSAQQLAEILSMRNRPTGEQALRILEFLNAENMKTPQLADPPRTRPVARADNPDQPRTLAKAQERIDQLNAQLKAQTPGAPKPVQQTPAPRVEPFDPTADPGFKRVHKQTRACTIRSC